MPNKLYKYTFSPPARLAWLSSIIYDVPTEIVNVDLSKAEQLQPDFLKVNPKHMVPAFDHDGEYITESREIAKYFHEHFNKDKEENDHWYPSDPDQRAMVDEWLDWSDRRHLTICKPALMQCVGMPGSPWRENYGIVMAVMPAMMKNNREANEKMKVCFDEAETILSERTITSVKDLNLGDLAVFFETSLPFFFHPDIHYTDYPNLHNLYKVLKQLPQFKQIDDEFCQFADYIQDIKENGPTPSIFTYFKETWATMKLVGSGIKNGIKPTSLEKQEEEESKGKK